MNTYQNSTNAYYFSNEEDVRLIEDAVRTAISNVIEVFCNINNNKMHEYQMKVAERDKENGMLRMQLERAERELVSLRKTSASTELRNSEDPDRQTSCDRNAGLSSQGGSRRHEDVHCEPMQKGEFTSPCERTVTWTSLPAREGPVTHSTGTCVPEHGDQLGFRKGAALVPLSEGYDKAESSPLSSLEIKEEPLDFETVYIKWEVCEERLRREEDILGKECDSQLRSDACVPLSIARGGPHRVVGVPGVSCVQSALLEDMAELARQQKRLSNRERQQRYREKIRADPERQRAYREKDRCRYQKRRKLICELPEQSQKLKRQAWREAARRHRARKKTFLQMAQLSCLGNTDTALSAAAHLRS